MKALDPRKPAPAAFEGEAVIISIDFEKVDGHGVTEVGISKLDTRDLKGLALGDRCREWIQKIDSVHFNVNGKYDHKHRFVEFHPHAFTELYEEKYGWRTRDEKMEVVRDYVRTLFEDLDNAGRQVIILAHNVRSEEKDLIQFFDLNM